MLQGKNHFPKMIFLFKLGTRPSGRTDLPLTGPGASQAVQRSFPASLAPPSCLAGCPIGSPAFLAPPWCLPGCPKWSFPASLAPPWCLPGCPKWSFPASLPPWCLAGCPNGPFLLAGASLVPPRLSKGPFLPGASPVSKCFSVASRVPVAQDPLLKAFVAQIPFLKALVAWPPGSTPDFGRAPDFVYVLVQLQWRTARFAANPGVGPTAGCP